jgi:hypothetical protein
MATILITGGRDFDNYDLLKRVLDVVCSASAPGEVLIVNGGCRGADQLSTQYAKSRGFKFKEYPILQEEKDRHGADAGPIRNQRMIDTAKPDRAVAFHGGKGTLDCLCRLYWAQVDTWVVGSGEVVPALEKAVAQTTGEEFSW